MQTCELNFSVTSTDYSVPLGLELWLDGVKIHDIVHVCEPQKISHQFSDVEGKHALEIRLKNKQSAHTHLDDLGQIVKDACLRVADIKFDQIQIQPIMTALSEYTHDHNGTTQAVTEKFHGTLGCNGTVRLEFASPVYVWLLENI